MQYTFHHKTNLSSPYLKSLLLHGEKRGASKTGYTAIAEKLLWTTDDQEGSR